MASADTIHEEFKNNLVEVRAIRGPGCHIELNVRAGNDLVKKARSAAIKTVNKEVTFAGFRKGKAPEDQVLKKYGAQVDKEIHRHLADLSYVEAQKLAKIPVLNNNSSINFDMKKLEENQAELSFTFETEPALPTIDPTLFKAKPVTRPEVSEKQINEAIHQMLYYYAQWTPIEDRAIEDGDAIMINLDTIENGVPTQVFNQIRFEVSKERMADWMKKLVTGAKSGDVLNGISQPDETATEEEKKEFLPKDVRISILKVEKAILPELDDEFAKKVGAPDVETMRKSITDMLNGKAEEKVRDELRDQVNDFLVETYAFDLPLSLVMTEQKHRLGQLMKNPKFKQNFEKMSAEEKKETEEKLKVESGQAVRLFYLSRKIVNDAKLPITHQDVQNEAVATMRSYNAQPSETIPKEIYALALSKIILAKAQDYVLAAQKAQS